jgi:hypothetical protein
MKRNVFLGILGLVYALATTPASTAGTINGSATISATPNGPNFDYTINLTNTGGPGGDNIETFWFGWVPGEDFLPTSPSASLRLRAGRPTSRTFLIARTMAMPSSS